jgi:Type I restriction enzyme R protein N terminus (HSDR_N)
MTTSANPHHLVLGELEDFLTGRILPDTHDERYRQKIARILVLENGFDKKDIEAGMNIEITAGARKARMKVDFLVHHEGRSVMLVKYAPGSLVTRRLSTLALSRVIKPYRIPFAVITNGEDAEILAGDSGMVTATGLDHLPDLEAVRKAMISFSFDPVGPVIFDQASRIAFACEIDGACPCDSDVCILE